jgi:hypothetical protein
MMQPNLARSATDLEGQLLLLDLDAGLVGHRSISKYKQIFGVLERLSEIKQAQFYVKNLVT